jgi:hypothetical protein
MSLTVGIRWFLNQLDAPLVVLKWHESAMLTFQGVLNVITGTGVNGHDARQTPGHKNCH